MESENYHRVTNLLLNFKFQPESLGFEYLRSAVLYYLDTNHSTAGITTEVYPLLAQKYNTKEASIERNIRMCVENAYENGGLLTLNDYYGAVVYTNKFKFSNSEIISILVELIKLDDLKRKITKQVKEKTA